MKKNKMMRLASALLVLTLLTTCTISGTFAKYVTSGTATDKARVAKWGVVLTMEADSMFSNEYTGTGSAITVKSVDDKNVVAPGTASTGATNAKFSITGVPEVATKVDVKFDNVADIVLKKGTYLDYTTANDTTDTFTLANDYYPVVFTLKQTVGVGPEFKGTLAEIEKALETWATTAKFAPNTDLAAAFELSWEWAFDGARTLTDGNGTAVTFDKDTVDKADTFLGQLAAGVETTTDPAKYNLDFEYDLTISVTQVD